MIGTRPARILALMVLVLLPECGFAQPDGASLARDTHLFRRLFHKLGCTPIKSDEEFSAADPRETVLIVLGDTSMLHRLEIGDYVKRGGSLLIATDRQLPPNMLFDFGVRLHGITGDPVMVAGAHQAYHGLPDCPFLVPTNSGFPFFMNGRKTLTKVATNRSGILSASGQMPTSRLKVIAQFPAFATFGDIGIPENFRMQFGAAAELGAGRVLILADHSVFINLMMLPPDNDNLEFAGNCVDWLTEHGRRRDVLFVDEGRGQTSFDEPMMEIPPPPLPPPEKIVAAFDQVLAGLEKENLLNDLFAGISESVPKERAIALSILSLSIMLGLYGMFRLTSAKQRHEPGIVPLMATIDELDLGRPIHELRTHALVKGGNYWDAAHELAIDIFEPLINSAGPGSRLKVKSDATSLWSAWRERRRVRAIWRLAVDAKPRRWTRGQWLQLHALDPALRRAIAAGKITLVSPSSVPFHSASSDALPKFHSAR